MTDLADRDREAVRGMWEAMFERTRSSFNGEVLAASPEERIARALESIATTLAVTALAGEQPMTGEPDAQPSTSGSNPGTGS